MSVHEFGVKDLVVLLGQRGSAPASVVVVGVQPANVAPGLEFSSEVEAALPTLVEAALDVLEAWS
jgi:hydrogenase maturation protease